MAHLVRVLLSRLPTLALGMECVLLASGCLRLLEAPEAEVHGDFYTPPDASSPSQPSPPDAQEGEPCVASDDPYLRRCREGLSCVANRCGVAECNDDAECGLYKCDAFSRTCETRCSPFAQGDCGPGAVCRGVSCVDGSCDAQSAPQKCGGFACQNGLCRGTCSSNADCQADHRCELGGCRPTCNRIDAPNCAPFVCNLGYGACELSCFQDSQCAGGHVCRGSQCVRNPEASACTAKTAAAVCGKSRCFEPPGVCAGPCSGDHDCAEGARCAPRPCSGELISCYPFVNECQTRCSSGRDPACGAYRCNLTTSTCESSCSADEPCAPGYRCNAQQKCEPAPATRACTSDAQCGVNACDLARRVCVEACAAPGDCSQGAVCHEQTCRPQCDAETAAAACQGFGCETLYVPSFCRTSCTLPNHCARGYDCIDGACRLNQACSGPYDCLGPFQCDTSLGRCLSWCSADQDCRSSYGCKSDATCWDL